MAMLQNVKEFIEDSTHSFVDISAAAIYKHSFDWFSKRFVEGVRNRSAAL
jgi:hypothetical protein